MKDYYTISEISKLYGIGTDSLRYYEEAGCLPPEHYQRLTAAGLFHETGEDLSGLPESGAYTDYAGG